MARVVRSGGSTPKARGSLSFLLPIIAAIVILVLVIKGLFSSSSDSNNTNGDFVTITPGGENSEVYVYMSGDSKKQISAESKLFSTDSKLEVRSWDATITLDGTDTSKLYADKLAEISYLGNLDTKRTFALNSSYLWVEAATGNLAFKLKNFNVTSDAGAIFALYQNAVGSNVYVLKGNVNVATESSSTSVSIGQMVTVLSNEVKTAKLPEKITPIDDFFKTTDLFVKHNGGAYLTATTPTTDANGSGATNGSGASVGTNSDKAIVITYPEDEMTVETPSVDVEGKIANSAVEKVTLNDKAAQINKEEKSFSFKGFALPSDENNIVYRAYDSNGIILSKGVITVRSSAKKSSETTTTKPTVTSYPVSDKDFKIIVPTENPYKTSEDVVRIQGQIAKWVVKYITINGYRLSKFSQYSTSWYYFANKDFGTLNEGINQYEIKYYGENDNLLSTGMFMIVKDSTTKTESSTDEKTPTNTSSGSTGSTSIKS